MTKQCGSALDRFVILPKVHAVLPEFVKNSRATSRITIEIRMNIGWSSQSVVVAPRMPSHPIQIALGADQKPITVGVATRNQKTTARLGRFAHLKACVLRQIQIALGTDQKPIAVGVATWNQKTTAWLGRHAIQTRACVLRLAMSLRKDMLARLPLK